MSAHGRFGDGQMEKRMRAPYVLHVPEAPVPTNARMLPGGDGPNGHLEQFSTGPIGLFAQVRAECGEVGQFRMGPRSVVLLSGAEANEWFFRGTEDELDQ